MNMKKLLTTAFLGLMMFSTAVADEGMWVVNMLQRIYNAELNQMGLNLTPEEIYSI